MSDDAATANAVNGDELTIDDLASRSGLPARTIREYQSMGLVPPPDRRGRVGIYGATHHRRLQLIQRLQDRGYSLAGIRDLLTSWQDGAELADVLGLASDELVHLDEPGAAASLEQLAHLLPQLVPGRLDELLAVGVIDACGPARYCVPSPSLLQLTVDALAAGYAPDAVLSLLSAIHDAAHLVATAAHTLISQPPDDVDDEQLDRLATRGRGLLGHGTGRLAIYTLGQLIERDTRGVRGAPWRPSTSGWGRRR